MLWGTVAQQLERLRGFALRQAAGDGAGARQPPAAGDGDTPPDAAALPVADATDLPRPPGEPPAHWLSDIGAMPGPPAHWLADVEAIRAGARAPGVPEWGDDFALALPPVAPPSAPVESEGKPVDQPAAPSRERSESSRPLARTNSAAGTNRAAAPPPLPPPGPSPPALGAPPAMAPPGPAAAPPPRTPPAEVRFAGPKEDAAVAEAAIPPWPAAEGAPPVPPPPPPLLPLRPPANGATADQAVPPAWPEASAPVERPAPAPVVEPPRFRPAAAPGVRSRRPAPLRLEYTPAPAPAARPAGGAEPAGGHEIAARSSTGATAWRTEERVAPWSPPAAPARTPRSGLLIETPAPPPDLRWANRAVAQRAVTWSTDAPGPSAAWDQPVVDDPWPALPAEEPPPAEDPRLLLRAWERQRRLDREQRGSGWSA